MSDITEETLQRIRDTKADLEFRLEICNAILDGMPISHADMQYGGKMNYARNLIMPLGHALPRIRIDNADDFKRISKIVKSPAERLYDAVFDPELKADSGSTVAYNVYQYPDDLDETVEQLLKSDEVTDREREIYEIRFVNRMTLKEAGQLLGITRERVRQIENQFIVKLRRPHLAITLAYGLKNSETLRDRKLAEVRYKSAMERFTAENTYVQTMNVAISELEAKHDEFEMMTAPQLKARLRAELDKIIEPQETDELLQRVPKEPAGSDDIDIDVLRLSVRPYNCLRRGGIRTIADLKQQDIETLLEFRNLGKSSLAEILRALKDYDGTVLPMSLSVNTKQSSKTNRK